MKKLAVILTVSLLTFGFTNPKEDYSFKLAVLKYSGGGDWYSNPSSLINLALFTNQIVNSRIDPDYDIVEAFSTDIFNYPFIHMTGHGNVVFSDSEIRNLRNYLEAGGFLHIDDNYGMDPFIRPELKKLFPESELTPLPASHSIFHQSFDFPKGLPKIHEHDNNPPLAYGIYLKGRMVVLYTSECDLGDGWEDAEVHNDPLEVREKALKMGCNILQYVFNHNE